MLKKMNGQSNKRTGSGNNWRKKKSRKLHHEDKSLVIRMVMVTASNQRLITLVIVGAVKRL